MKSKKLFIIVIAIISVTAITGGSVFAYNSQPQVRLENALNTGEKYLDELKYEMAIASFKEAIEIDPTEVQAYRGLINVYAQQGNYQEVVNQYNAAAENVSEDALEGLRGDVIAALQNGAERANANGDYGSAGFCYEQILVIDAGNLNAREKLCEVYLLMAEQEKNGGNYDKAIEYCDKALSLNAGYVAANEKLCEIYLIIANNAENEKDYDKAAEYYNNILALYPGHEEANKKLCDVYLAMAANAESEGRYEEAVEYCNKILAMNPDNKGAVDKLIGLYLILAGNAEAQGNYDKAKEYYDKILALNSNQQDALNGMARLNERKGIAAYESALIAMAENIAGIESGEVYDFSDTLILGDEFHSVAGGLTAPVIFNAGDGKYLGVYPGGYIYYGEMENGMRSGKGYWYLGFMNKITVAECPWSNNLPNGNSTITAYYNMEDNYCQRYTVNLVNGVYEGLCTYVLESDGVFGGRNPEHEYDIIYSGGIGVVNEDGYLATCKICGYYNLLPSDEVEEIPGLH